MRRLINAFRPSLQDRLDQQITMVANLRGEVEAHRVGRDYHAARVEQIDPHKDWWTFAHHKQAVHDAQVEVECLQGRCDKQTQRLEAMLSAMLP